MGNLIECRTCGKPVSSSAAFCPHCGERWPESFKQRFTYGLIGFAAVLLGGLIVGLIIALVLWVRAS